MKPVLVGGPLLGSCRSGGTSSTTEDADHTAMVTTTFAPIITPLIGSDKPERFVLLPNQSFVTVLAYKTGKRIGALLPTILNETGEGAAVLEITAVALTNHHFPSTTTTTTTSSTETSEQVLLVACNDATIRIFQLSDLQKPCSTLQSCGPYLIPGSCFRPRVVIQLSSGYVKHMGVAPSSDDGSIVVYAAVENSSSDNDMDDSNEDEKEEPKPDLSLVRITLPLGQEKSRGLVKLEDLDTKESLYHCLDKNVKSQTEEGQEPFSLVVAPAPSGKGSLILLPCAGAILVYLEPRQNPQSACTPFIIKSYTLSRLRGDPLVSIAVSRNDIACGLCSGAIRILTDFFPRVEAFFEAMTRYDSKGSQSNVGKPNDPTKGLVIRTLHWHSLPVATLAFAGVSNAPFLYSGGDESVLVTWQLDRGTTKPAEVLPRIARGAIVQLCFSHQPGEHDTILVYCSDNSLHLFETHNQHRKWKIQGIAPPVKSSSALSSIPRILVDPLNSSHSPNIILTGLSKAPGMIHTYDPNEQRVVSSLEVVPYNRVSRTELGDSPMPEPSCSSASWSTNGDDLLTIDTTPTENPSIGACERLEDGSTVGSTTTIRFWSRNSTNNGYDLVAAMASPHGFRNRVAAAVLSPDAKYACTVSNDEKAFRLWKRGSPSSGDAGIRRAAWSCEYKVYFPAGYSNHPTGNSAVAFSSDATVLAIAFGNMITLWDRHQVTLLTSLRHPDDNDAAISSLEFIQSTKLVPDLILATSAHGVSLQSPYGKQGPSRTSWVWAVPSALGNMRVTDATFVPLSEIVLISLLDERNCRSRILFVDVATGRLSSQRGLPPSVDIVGDEIMCVTGVAKRVGAWGIDDEKDQVREEHKFFALTKTGDLISITNYSGESERTDITALPHGVVSEIPRLPEHLRETFSRKRSADILTMEHLGEAPKQKLSLDNFGSLVGDETTKFALPSLTGAFTRAFVGRNLRRREQ